MNMTSIPFPQGLRGEEHHAQTHVHSGDPTKEGSQILAALNPIWGLGDGPLHLNKFRVSGFGMDGILSLMPSRTACGTRYQLRI